MNSKIIMHVLGWVLVFEAAALLLPLVCALAFGEPYVLLLLECIGICLAAGGVLILFAPKDRALYAREGFVTVALSWIVLSVFGALPFWLSGQIPNYVDALFETVSGFTTTGASILTDVEAMPKCLLMWRSFTHWIGGMGVLVLLMAVLPLSGGSNLYLLKAESPGPAVGKLVPRVRSSAKILYGIYTFLTALQIVFLLFGGMTLFESVTLSLGTAGTGGFAILNTGAATYSPYVQVVITVFMIIFGVDFSLYYLALNGRFKSAFSSCELKAYLGIILASTAIIGADISGMFSSVGEALRHSAFQVASIITTTGYSTADFDKWPELSKTMLVMLMFIGACAGSTGGGIKVSRIIIMLKSIAKELKIIAHPNSTHKITMNGRTVEHETVRGVNVFLGAYLVIFVITMLIISLDDFGFTTNFTAIATTINNIGPGLEAVGPTCNFSAYSDLSKLTLIFNMLAGRLELFPLLVLFSVYTWKK